MERHMTDPAHSQDLPNQPNDGHQENFNALKHPTSPTAGKSITSALAQVITGDSLYIRYFKQPTAEGEQLTSAFLVLPSEFRNEERYLTLQPFPRGVAAEKLYAFLEQARTSGARADVLLADLKALGEDANGVGWIPIQPIPFHSRAEWPALTAVAPTLEMIINKDPSMVSMFASSRCTNGTFEICTAQLKPSRPGIDFKFYSSDNHEAPRLVREINFEMPHHFRSRYSASPNQVHVDLRNLTKEFQSFFFVAGINTACQRIDRFSVKFNREDSNTTLLDQDDRLRLLVSVRAPFEFAHILTSGARIAIERGENVISLFLKGSYQANASMYVAILDRMKLDLSDNEWVKRREQFIRAGQLLTRESEALQIEALETIMQLCTQQASFPASLEYVLNRQFAQQLKEMASTQQVVIRSGVGYSPQELQKLCDGCENITVWRPNSPLDSETLDALDTLSIDFKTNGELVLKAYNKLGNQVLAHLSKKCTNTLHGPAKLAFNLMSIMMNSRGPTSRFFFEGCVSAAADLDLESSYYINSGTPPYTDLPALDDEEGLQAFALASALATLVVDKSKGHGKHVVHSQSPGIAEARLQFSGAPYDLKLCIKNTYLTQAEFVPKQSTTDEDMKRHSFFGNVHLTGLTRQGVLEGLAGFAKWGSDHSRRDADAAQLESSQPFAIFQRLLQP